MAVSIITGGKSVLGNKREVNDYYPTPYCSTESLMNFLTKQYKFKKKTTIIEPCAGKRHIVKVIKKHTKSIIKSCDLYDYGDKKVETGVDMLAMDENIKYDWVITNPPFKNVINYVEKALNISNTGVALFLKLTFLESSQRYDFFKKNKQLKHVLIFSNRQPLYKNGINTGISNAICFAWFIWDKSYNGSPMIDWVLNNEDCKNNIY